MKKSILDDDILLEYRKINKIQPYKIKQIQYEIYNNAKISFDEMTTLSKELRQQLSDEFYLISLKVDKIIETTDTTKFSFKTMDGYILESVLMFHTHDKGNEVKLNRITQCLSTQVGCPIGCKFCVTGTLGIKRNLTWQEMIEQVIFANNYISKKYGKKPDGTLWKVRNIVFMGMGEPLLNYSNLLKSIDIMLQQTKLSLSKRHITISTVGIIPGIENLIKDKIDVMLAVSLHSANQQIRENLIPVSKTYGLDKLKNSLNKYLKATNIRIFYEYIMIDGITDTIGMAQELVNYIKDQDCHVNLIPYNENPACDYKESTIDNINKFKNFLVKNNIIVTVRGSLGRDTKGACGQLGYEYMHDNN